MHPHKSYSCHFPGLLYLTLWSLTGPAIMLLVTNLFGTGLFPLNHTIMVLIHQLPYPEGWEYHAILPFSMCVVLYEVIVKVLVKCLRPHLNSIVRLYQSSLFLPVILERIFWVLWNFSFDRSFLSIEEMVCTVKRSQSSIDWNFFRETTTVS